MIDPQIAEGPLVVTDRTLRQFAALWILFLGGMACWLGLVRDRAILALVFAGLAVPIGALGLARPQSIRLIFTGMMAVTFPIGWVVSHLVLAVLFFGVFTPVGLFFKLIGRDALARRRRTELPTHWARHPVVSDVRSYFRQS